MLQRKNLGCVSMYHRRLIRRDWRQLECLSHLSGLQASNRIIIPRLVLPHDIPELAFYFRMEIMIYIESI